ncbi:MAG TPA: carbonic anhydrase [Solirubrobacteraceae bacterium]|nr:carbonic anhydrase [Solirubrobacteraceae bacterium]
MTDLDALLDRNKRYATTQAFQALPIAPRRGVCVITCLDSRTDPAKFLELELGEAAVIRNAGGRVTQAVIDDLAFIGYLSETILKPEGPMFEVAVIHHNKCGTSFLADADFRRNFVARTGGDDAALATKAVTDPVETVRHDVELLRSSTVLSPKIRVSGHVYDVDTGVVTTIVPASPMRTD